MKRANYGIDAPTVVRNLALGAVACFILAAVVVRAFIGPALGFTFAVVMMLWSSLVGKFHARDRLLDAIPWRGDERVLDVGCGHGLLLIGAARRVPRGSATGIDIWQDVDQANNSADATRRNAELEGVTVEVRDGDARRIPFEDASFDVVVSSLALHNIYDARERDVALAEIARVTKPGGYIGIIDIRHDYTGPLSRFGCSTVKKWRMFLFVGFTGALVMRKG